MTELTYFFGRFHVLVLHFPIVLVSLATLFQFLASGSWDRQNIRHILPFMWLLTFLFALLTVLLGLLHFTEGGFDTPTGYSHRNWALVFTLLSGILWFISAKNASLYKKVGSPSSLLLVVLVLITGHYGGNITHGSTYLTEYAPQPIRVLVGADVPRSAPLTLAEADPWHDLIQPMLTSRCQSCHSDSKQRGQLNLSNFEALMKGGENGAVAVAGSSAESEMYRRVTLSGNHEDFMPAEGKTPLTPEQVSLLKWWLDAGMPANTTLASSGVDLSKELAALAVSELGLSSSETESLANSLAIPMLSQQQLAELTKAGFIVRLESQQLGGYLIRNQAPGLALSTERVGLLEMAAGSVTELDLASAQVTDDLLPDMALFTELTHLNLSNNLLTDAVISKILQTPKLEVLNLYGNPRITDLTLKSLEAVSSQQNLNLRKLYLWQTSVSSAAIDSVSDNLISIGLVGGILDKTTTTITESESLD